MKFGFRAALAVALVLMSIVSVTVVASAHALYVSSTPAANSTLKTAPTTLKALFAESVNPKGSSLTVAGPNGVADLGDGHVDQSDPDRKTMLVSLKPNLPSGRYTVSWATVSGDDGDPANGTFTFTIALPAPVATPVPVLKAAASPATLPKTGGVPWQALVLGGAVLALAGVAARRMAGHDRSDRRAE